MSWTRNLSRPLATIILIGGLSGLIWWLLKHFLTNRQQKSGPSLSLMDIPSGNKSGVNSQCHGYFDGVSQHASHIIPNPQVFIIYWDSYFSTIPAAVASMNQFVSDLVTGTYIDGLAQYGVGQGGLIGSIVIDMTKYPAPASLTRDDLQLQLTTWLGNGTIQIVPEGNEINRVYLILPPSTSVLLLNGITGFCGYHSHGKYISSTNNDNLFWAVVQGYSQSNDSQTFVDSISYCVSHEMAEMFSDRDGQGYYSSGNGCEIGDLCEVDMSGNVLTMPYQGPTGQQWPVELYWSNKDGTCILGASPSSTPQVTITPLPYDVWMQSRSLTFTCTFTVHAEDPLSHATVAGWVLISNRLSGLEVVGKTDTPITCTFHVHWVLKGWNSGVHLYEVGKVIAPAYIPPVLKFGFPYAGD